MFSRKWIANALLLCTIGATACACSKKEESRTAGASSTTSSMDPLGAAQPKQPAEVDDADAGQAPFEVHFRSGPYLLRGFVFKPAGAGPFPVVVYNHGSELEPSIEFLGMLGKWFQEHGFVAFFPYRRGSVGSEGPYWQDVVNSYPESERARGTVEQMEEQNADVVAAINWIRAKSYVDRPHVSVAGCSFGGIQTVLTAEKELGIYAAVDFAGAAMAWARSPLLQDRLKKAVRSAKVPLFFVQAQNDYDTSPSLALAEEMFVANKAHKVHIFPPNGKTHREGHGKFCTYGMSAWGDEVLDFLRQPPVMNAP